MPRIIIKTPNIKAKGSGGGFVKYIAKREGVDKMVNSKITIEKPTQKQIEYINQMLSLCPEAKDTFEYQDYMDNPTPQNASAFISVAAENNPQIFENRETYLNYIAIRPNVEKTGTHGLFGMEDDVELEKVKREIESQKSVIWIPIISLTRQDAARLGYDNASAWRDLIRSKHTNLADIFQIPYDEFKWYAAYHDEGHHPHVHMVVYAKDSTKGHLTERGIEKMKSIFANDIFKNDMYELYDEKSRQRDKVSEESKNKLKELVEKIYSKDFSDSPVCEMLLDLSRKLKTVTGKKVYGYLPKPIKKDVDAIVQTMASDQDIQNLYNEWCAIQSKIVAVYQDKEIEHLPLWENKEFKKIKNAVIAEAVKLSDDRVFVTKEDEDETKETEYIEQEIKSQDTRDREDGNTENNENDTEQMTLRTRVFFAAYNLFCRLASIIDKDAHRKADGYNKSIVDSKDRIELAKKKQKLGIKMR